MKANRNSMRAELLAELDSKPRSTATTPTIPAASPDESRSIEDIIRNAARSIK
jgi:hypothetical protein